MNVDETKGMQLLFGKKSSVWMVDLCGACVVSGLVVILFIAQNGRCRFIVIVLMCLGRSVCYPIWMSKEHDLFIIVQCKRS